MPDAESFARDAELCGVVCSRLRNARRTCVRVRNSVILWEYGLQSPTMLRLSDPPAIIEFRHFSIFPHRRQLLADGRPITLGVGAFDVPMALIEASGAFVAKEKLQS